MLPESPRWLISRDRDEEAFAILVKMHAEGDADSLLVKAEMAQIKSTIKIELDNSKQSWMDMVSTAGMRRRVLVSCFLGLFTQMSGNTLLSYYQNLLYTMMGYTSTYAKTRINLANGCWSFMTAVTAAFVVARFKRRHMFMLSSTTMLIVFTAMTISFEKLREASDGKYSNDAAGVAALFFYFAYAPCYNIGNNALTYSMSPHPSAALPIKAKNSLKSCPLPIFAKFRIQTKHLLHFSLPRRTLPLRHPHAWYRNRADFRQDRRFLLQQRQPRCPDRSRLEVPRHLLWLDCLRTGLHLRLLP
jgi:hypothetical protein